MATPKHVVGVIGAGFMGSGIAGEFARAGHKVHCFDTDPNMFQKSRATIKENLDTLAKGGVLSEEQAARALENVQYHTDIAVVASSSTFIIEAVFEDINVKKDVFSKLDEHAAPTTILSSNTSSLSIAEIAAFAPRHKTHTLAVHFLHPAHLIPLVEITPTPNTDPSVVEEVKTFLTSINKSPVLLKREIPGYLAARLQAALFREALYLVEEGIVSVEDVDKAVKDGFGRRLNSVGPMEVADMAGLDIYAKTSQVMFPSLANTSSAAQLDKLVAEGKLGAKSGNGYYKWDDATFNAVKNKRDAELLRRLKQ